MSTHPRPLKRVVIKEELVALTGHYIEALILNQFIYWSERTKDFDKFIDEERQRNPDAKIEVEPRHGWIYKSADELSDELMLGSAPATIRRYLGKLVEKGFLQERNNPNHAWDRCLQYRPDVNKIQIELHNLGYPLDGYPNVTIFHFEKCNHQNEKSIIQSEKSNFQNEGALPEITTETTTNNSPQPDFLDQVFALQGQVSETTADNPNDQWFAYRDRFMGTFQQLMGRHPDRPVEEGEIGVLAGEPDACPIRWETAITESKLNWTGNGDPPLARIIEVYRAGGTWEAWRKQKFNGNGENGHNGKAGIDNGQQRGLYLSQRHRQQQDEFFERIKRQPRL